MLNFILGRSGSGKSFYILEQIRQTLQKGKQKILLVVPEQFSFETERKIYQSFIGEELRRIEVLSFQRLAHHVFRQYGGLAGEYADDSDKTVLMSMALDQMKDALTVYSKTSNPALTKAMLEAVEEFKTWGVSAQQLSDAAEILKEGRLKDKLIELSQIYFTYDGLIGRLYVDPLDDIARAGKLLETHFYFKNTVVYIDEFDGFTANENVMLEAMLRQADEVYASLCMPSIQESGIAELFAPVRNTLLKLKALADKCGVPVASPIVLEAGKRFSSPEIFYLEQHVLSQKAEAYPHNCRNIRIFEAPNQFEEVEYVLATLKRLVLEEGMRYRDIIITARDLAPYQEVLYAGFAHYDIPFFMDMLSPITEKALIRFVENLLKIAVSHCDITDAMNLLKCGMMEDTVEDVSRFENYVYTWNIKGSGMQKEFTAHPRGYEERLTEEDREELAHVNQIRERLVSIAEELSEVGESRDGRQISAAVYGLLERLHVKENVQTGAETLLRYEQEMLAKECVQTWDILMGILDSLAASLKGTAVSLKRYLELYQLVAGNYQVGSIPQQLDAVTVGSSERIRIANPRAVFILGVNDGVFPYVPSANSLLTDHEKKQLAEVDLQVSRDTEEMILQERFLAYKALTGASERLYLSYRRCGTDGKPLARSFLIEQMKAMFGEACFLYPDQLDAAYYCWSGQSIFSHFAQQFHKDNTFRATAEQYLKEQGYRERIDKLYRIFYRRGFQLQNKQIATELFGKEMRLSASKFEHYHQCRFLYFCEEGLKVKPRKKAELNPIETGTLIHDVLYHILSEQEPSLIEMTDIQLREAIQLLLEEYISIKMGGKEDKTKRFLYLYQRLNRTLFQILSHLREEMQQSDFVPTDFELQIGRGKAVDALEVVAPDGSRVWIEGRIDRVDTYEKNGVKYVRVVDYKTGVKSFKLSDVFYGVNMQMLIYLFSIWNTQHGKYKGSMPAGILYMPAKGLEAGLEREAKEEQIAQNIKKSYQMNGLLLDDEEIIEAMEHEISGVFIPVKRLKKKGEEKNSDEQHKTAFSASSKVASLAQLGSLKAYTEKLLGEMAEELHNGKIAAAPLTDGKTSPCLYCDYRAVCGREENDPVTEQKDWTDKAVLERIEEVLENEA